MKQAAGKYVPFDQLPLFAGDDQIGSALLGPKRACEWRGLAQVLERKGLPPVDTLMGGRYTPAVKAYFDRDYGLRDRPPSKPQGVEGALPWQKKKTA